jgi:hypothetical protein
MRHIHQRDRRSDTNLNHDFHCRFVRFTVYSTLTKKIIISIEITVKFSIILRSRIGRGQAVGRLQLVGVVKSGS